MRFQQFSFWLVCDVNVGNSSGLFQDLMRSFEIRRDQGKFVQMPPPSPTMLASWRQHRLPGFGEHSADASPWLLLPLKTEAKSRYSSELRRVLTPHPGCQCRAGGEGGPFNPGPHLPRCPSLRCVWGLPQEVPGAKDWEASL